MKSVDPLKKFDALPDAAAVEFAPWPLCAVAAFTATWAVPRGALPKPRKIGGSTRWNVGELRKVLLPASGAEA